MPVYPDKEFENMPILEAPELRKKKGISGAGWGVEMSKYSE